jgi:hypothetical protein
MLLQNQNNLCTLCSLVTRRRYAGLPDSPAILCILPPYPHIHGRLRSCFNVEADKLDKDNRSFRKPFDALLA